MKLEAKSRRAHTIRGSDPESVAGDSNGIPPTSDEIIIGKVVVRSDNND